MKKVILWLMCIHFANAQKDSISFWQEFKPQFKLHTEVNRNSFFGDNYLSKGNENSGIGLKIGIYPFKFKNFELGTSFRKNFLTTTDFAIGGNIKNNNVNSINLELLYHFYFSKKFYVTPNIRYGGNEIKSFNETKKLGRQTGEQFGTGINLNYKLFENFNVFTGINYDYYKFKTNTNAEFLNYFNNTNAFYINFGFRI